MGGLDGTRDACQYRVFENNNEPSCSTIVDEMALRSISSTIVASSSIGLTISDAVCTVLCS
jgi:hypothetical protein